MTTPYSKDWLERGKKFFRVRQRDVVYTSLRGWTGDEPAKPGVVEPAKWKVVAKVVTPLYPIAIGLNLAVVPYLTDIPMVGPGDRYMPHPLSRGTDICPIH